MTLQCPLPIDRYPSIIMAHGGGGRLTQQLVSMFRAAFDDEGLNGNDAAVLGELQGKIAVTTDGFVVTPRFFPGGSIGSLAVYGSVNDLACVGAKARHLTASFILEEGFAIEELWRVVLSMAEAARSAGVSIVAGDTKVVGRGQGDGVYIHTTGIGVVAQDHWEQPSPSDVILVSGDIGRHGIAVMMARGELGLSSDIESDCGSIWPAVHALIEQQIQVRVVRDLTRGGLATILNELGVEHGLGMEIDETRLPVEETVNGACELLGIDPLYVANEGTFVALVAKDHADKALEILRKFRKDSQIIGRTTASAGVVAKNAFGSKRVLDVLSGEQLPRIC